ncbi:hypothetical protein COK06_05545 [Bacillus cereus]|nr:hypothetical protein CN428_13755 [Bacillus cereus]PEZ92835.1 hypothetical protein CN374_02465 [Bacillus cereus]PFA31566.1 hypothetical protein CN390_17905 [Bacillus cereus]PFB97181.1 hypothetical protein CN296_16725 [Bacillus cereus]PFE56199.1 hypothetical protein CN318_13300 [Bacillus cereus]
MEMNNPLVDYGFTLYYSIKKLKKKRTIIGPFLLFIEKHLRGREMQRIKRMLNINVFHSGLK